MNYELKSAICGFSGFVDYCKVIYILLCQPIMYKRFIYKLNIIIDIINIINEYKN